jgi:SAM-dependent methyltransferase
VIGVDQSAEMLDRARARVSREGWSNVTLVESPASTAPVVGPVDRILIHYVHDVMRCPASLDRVLGQLRPGGRLVAAGPRWAPWWAAPLSLWVWLIARPYHTTFEGFGRPWSHLATRLRDLDVERSVFGRAYFSYIATGTVH